MERVSLKSRWMRRALWMVFAIYGSQAAAGVVFVPPAPVELNPNGERYPTSSFGKGPTEPATEQDSGSADRRPAGLEFGSAAQTSAPRSNPIVPAGTELKRDPVLETLGAARKGIQEVALIAGDLGFFPKTVFVTRDIPVRMFVTGASKNTLCIMMDSFQVRKQVRSQKIEEITFTPGSVGKYRFYCPVNGMEGTMIVRETMISASE